MRILIFAENWWLLRRKPAESDRMPDLSSVVRSVFNPLSSEIKHWDDFDSL